MYRVRKSIFLIVALSLLCGASLAQMRGGRAVPPTISLPPVRPLSVDILSFEHEPPAEDSVRLDIYLAVPYSSVSFLYAVDKYVADYAVIIQITDAGATSSSVGKLVVDKYQTYSLQQSSAQRGRFSSLDVERADASQYSFSLQSDHEYDVRVAVRDLANQRERDSTYHIRTAKFGSGVALSDMMLYRTRKGAQILPSIGPDISGLPTEGAGVFAELYHGTKGASYGVVVRLSNYGGANEELARWSSVVVPTGEERTPVFQNLNIPDLWMGEYQFELYILKNPEDTSLRSGEDLLAHSLAHRSRTVRELLRRGLPSSIADIDEAIDQVALVATSSEMDSLRTPTSPQEKRLALAEFWRKRKPLDGDRENQPMNIFYRRVEYANENYAGVQHGWRSDRGRIYIVLGAPTYIDRHPYDVNQKPYETWEYSDLSARYVFVDQYMLGEYRLYSAPPPSGMFLWQRESY